MAAAQLGAGGSCEADACCRHGEAKQHRPPCDRQEAADAGDDDEDEDPQGVGVDLDALADVEHRAVAGEHVVNDAEVDVAVVRCPAV